MTLFTLYNCSASDKNRYIYIRFFRIFVLTNANISNDKKYQWTLITEKETYILDINEQVQL